jgi:3-dehydroquinate synthase
MNSISIKSNIRDYSVTFHDNAAFISTLKSMPNSVFIIDKNVWAGHSITSLAGIKENEAVIIEIDENRKGLNTVQELYDRIIEYSPKKNMVLISVGGGIMQDVTGFLASTLYRGIKWIFLPTTTLAQADSCIGSKTSLNYRHYKNLIGTFYPPHEVHIYAGFLKTLNKLDFFSGIGEIAKLHIMGGEKTIERFIRDEDDILHGREKQLLDSIECALNIKKGYIEGDEFDSGRRNMLNYGHCFGHAIESATDFGIPHGQAIVIGMMLANIAANARGILSEKNEDFFYHKILKNVISVRISDFSFNIDDIIQNMKQDKKRTGSGLPLVMIDNNMEMLKITDLAENEVASAFNHLQSVIKSQV